jgi:GTP-binding protein
LRAGHGGKGSASFRHEPFVPRGGPDGGDGGRGGSIVLRATTGMTDLSEYARRSHWHAPAGEDGAGGRKTGKRGADVTLDVPVGTMVLNESGALIADLDEPDASQVIAAGGEGGRGNVHFKSSSKQAPDHAEPGLPGEEKAVVLDLKLIADVGLVGPPNAGKSSLLESLTAATPKVGAYPFTTLDPELGVMEEGGEGERRLVLADIPGLLEGASQGVGLGLRFLRHVERTRVLAYVVDGAAADPWADLDSVRAEVETFSSGLGARPHLVVVNKLDLEETRRLRSRSRKKSVLFVSALSGEGLDELKKAMLEAVERAPLPSIPQPAAVLLPVRRSGTDPLVVERLPWGFAISGDRVERLVAHTNFESDGSLERFQVELDRIGVNTALEGAGAQPGDTVRIGAAEFEYQP